MGLANQEKSERSEEKKSTILGNTGSEHHQTSEDERKKLKRVSQKNEKST